jgi:RNA recognition motif-containing protein
MFEAHGVVVTDCFLPIERDSCRPRGYAFVFMPAKDAEEACAKVNGLELDGHTLRVNVYMEAQPKGEYTLTHYYDQFTCMKQRKWFEDLRSSDKVICMFTSGVFNGEFDDEGNVNTISLFAVFPFSNHIQLG